MKKIILISAFVIFCTAGFSQLFKPVPTDYFRNRALGHSSWIPRINVGINAISYGKNPETKQIEVVPLNAICFGMGYLHYKDDQGEPFNDFGFNLAYLQLIDKAGSGVGLYGTYNTGQIGLLNLGCHYDFAVNRFFLDTGITFHF
jgi:hypothetical protein